MDLISVGTESFTIQQIMKDLLLTNQYTALAVVIKHPAYDFSEIYESVCKYLTVKHVKDITNTLAFEDQVALLSEGCIINAHQVWSEIKPQEIMSLPISPFAHKDFNPIYVKPDIFDSLLQHAIENYKDYRRKPINFYYWMLDTRVKPYFYFIETPKVIRRILSFLNPQIFFSTDAIYQNWLLHSIERYMIEALHFSSSSECNETWLSLLKIFITLKSIHLSMYSESFNPIKRCFLMMNNILTLAKGIDTDKYDKYGKIIIKLIKMMDFDSTVQPNVLQIFNVFVETGHDIHPDWIISLLSCKLPAEFSDYYRILMYISERNPHHETIDVLAQMFSDNLYPSIYSHFLEIFGEAKLLENPAKAIFRPLQGRFRELRARILPFPNMLHCEFISGLLNTHREPYDLYKDIMKKFSEDSQKYSRLLSSVQICSFDRKANRKPVSFAQFLSRAFQSFMGLTDFYIKTTDSSSCGSWPSIIFSPILPKLHVHILMSFVVHNSLLAKNPVPFILDYDYFIASLRGKLADLKAIYNESHILFELAYLKISQLFHDKYWFKRYDYMEFILENYDELELISDENVKIDSVPEEARAWLLESFMTNASAIRSSVYSFFKLTEFNSLDIYYILFEKYRQ